MAHGLSCCTAFGIFLDQGLKLSPALAGGFFNTEPPGKPSIYVNHNKLLILHQVVLIFTYAELDEALSQM